jgi:hypothetical protein
MNLIYYVLILFSSFFLFYCPVVYAQYLPILQVIETKGSYTHTISGMVSPVGVDSFQAADKSNSGEKGIDYTKQYKWPDDIEVRNKVTNELYMIVKAGMELKWNRYGNWELRCEVVCYRTVNYGFILEPVLASGRPPFVITTRVTDYVVDQSSNYKDQGLLADIHNYYNQLSAFRIKEIRCLPVGN